ncbi:nucleotide-binding protein [Curtobacterium flaccumfaciens pv. oortii]|uniref:TIR domain-containing protein n=1 Tax=Curtobacterium flaccumfaciens TaxID=2035 RepID=UPI00265B7180|nr:TIR domain-containing protein [Curtobacterium flaccumfaciens]MCS5524704.1 nucleotide-binding protein [Curtobacterium flaccumfaciens pv. oortii]
MGSLPLEPEVGRPYDLRMARPDPLQAAAGYYAAERWEDSHWRQFGRETGTSDILSSHPRLYRSLSFGDDDYPDAALEALGRVLDEGVEDRGNEAERMDLLADSMPDLPSWVNEHAPNRTKRLFQDYLDARDPSEIPSLWSGGGAADPPADSPPAMSFDARFTPPNDPWDVPSSPAVFDKAANTAPTDSSRTVEPEPAEPLAAPAERSIFIVHGHDESAMNSIRVYVTRETKILPISLAEEASEGQTIIEKFEAYGERSSYVIVLLTPDDVGQTIAEHDAGDHPRPRARQNVVLELGYFIGKIGRKNIVVVNADVERPSDLGGLGYVQYPGSNWKDDLRTELKAAGLTV